MLAGKLRGRLLGISAVLGTVLAFAPASYSASSSRSSEARALATSGFDLVWSALQFPGRWAVASLDLKGMGFGVDTLLFIGVNVAVYFLAFWIIGQMWMLQTISRSRPRNCTVTFDDDPKIEAPNAFRRAAARVAPVVTRQYRSLGSSQGRSLPLARI